MAKWSLLVLYGSKMNFGSSSSGLDFEAVIVIAVLSAVLWFASLASAWATEGKKKAENKT